MEPKQLAQFCHTLHLRIRLGIAYACLVLVLLVLGAFTASANSFCGRNRPVRLCGVHWGCFCPQALRPCIFPVRRVLR